MSDRALDLATKWLSWRKDHNSLPPWGGAGGQRVVESYVVPAWDLDALCKSISDRESFLDTAREEGRKQGLDEAAALVRTYYSPNKDKAAEAILALKDKEPS